MTLIAIIPSASNTDSTVNCKTSKKLANLLYRNEIQCIITNWNDLDLSSSSILTKGFMKKENGFVFKNFQKKIRPDYVYFYCTSNSKPVSLNSLSSLQKFSNTFLRKKLTYNKICFKILKKIKKLSIPTNFNSDAGRWGVKIFFHNRCNSYKSKTGISVPHLNSKIISYPDDRQEISSFLENDEFIVLKPTNSSRGRGIVILNSKNFSKSNPLKPRKYLIQHLFSDPLLINNIKVDFRVHLSIFDLCAPQFSISSTVLIRFASKDYVRGILESEICDAAFSRRMGKTPRIETLDFFENNDFPEVDLPLLKSNILETMNQLMEAISQRANDHYSVNSILFWGVDLAIKDLKHNHDVSIIEINPYPAIFRNIPHIDSQIENMLFGDFFSKI